MAGVPAGPASKVVVDVAAGVHFAGWVRAGMLGLEGIAAVDQICTPLVMAVTAHRCCRVFAETVVVVSISAHYYHRNTNLEDLTIADLKPPKLGHSSRLSDSVFETIGLAADNLELDCQVSKVHPAVELGTVGNFEG